MTTSFEEVMISIQNAKAHLKFWAWRSRFVEHQSAHGIAEILDNEIRIIDYEIAMLLAIRGFGSSAFMALLSTSSKQEERNLYEELARGKVTRVLLSSENDLEWERAMATLKKELVSLQKKRKQVEKQEVKLRKFLMRE